jgi:Rha family phage regulatory protein
MNDLSEFVVLNDTTLTTDSRRVAKHFKKAHKSVLRAIDNLECSNEFSQRNFAPRDFIDSRGKQQREISMTKDGFMFLAMGFKGSEAAKFKESSSMPSMPWLISCSGLATACGSNISIWKSVTPLLLCGHRLAQNAW